MTTSILNDVKHMLGIMPEETAFDQDIIIYINGAFGALTQLGVGPVVGFQITDATKTWDDFVTDPRLNAAKSYIFLCVKMLFNPPDTGFVLASMERQKTEMEYRLNVVADYG
jgi:hypothetical protein